MFSPKCVFSWNRIVLFSPQWHLNRPGLLLANGMVYIAFGSHGDAHAGTYHGWVLGFDAPTLKHVSTFNATPDNSTYGAGIWQGGMGLASDSAGSVYFTTGNGSFNATKEVNVLRTTWKTSTDPNAAWTAWTAFDPDPGPVTYVATGQLSDGRFLRRSMASLISRPAPFPVRGVRYRASPQTSQRKVPV
jgi:hypothetical protein